MATPDSAAEDLVELRPMLDPTENAEQPDDSVGQRLRDARRAQGLTQQQVADKLDVSRRAVSEWETGVRQPHTALPALSALYGVSTSFLLYGVETATVELRELRANVTLLVAKVDALQEEVALNRQKIMTSHERLVELAEQTAAAFDELRRLIEA